MAGKVVAGIYGRVQPLESHELQKLTPLKYLREIDMSRLELSP